MSNGMPRCHQCSCTHSHLLPLEKEGVHYQQTLKHTHTHTEGIRSVDVPNVMCFELVHKPALTFRSNHSVTQFVEL